MRIMIATETYSPCLNGPAVFTRRLAAGLADRGHAVAVVAPSPSGRFYTETEGKDLTVIRMRSIPTPYPDQRCALLTRRGAKALLSEFRPDLLHIQNHFVLGRTLARAAKASRIPVLGTNHFLPENMLPHAPGVLLRWGATRRLVHHEVWRHFVRAYERLDAVTVPSHTAANLVRARGLKGPVHVISNGVEVARFRPPARQEPASSDGRAIRPSILYVGRLDSDKGLEVLIRAMPYVLEHQAADLLLCGKGVHEPPLRRLVESLTIAANVRFTGVVPDDELPRTYRAATVFVMPSPNELQSLATLEALASGVPVIAANALALPELVHEGGNGFLFSPSDSGALA
ncbi:MAG: glycosyltransferase, partial [candidate division NC10 bacterium]|nr:glycosyltransferase [candidate division NC10 bacterium]